MGDQMRILMAAYPFPPYMWAPGASIRLVKFLKYMARHRPELAIDVVTAGYGEGEGDLPHMADDLLGEIPDTVRVIRINDPYYLAEGEGAEHIASNAGTPIPDRHISWNGAVLEWLVYSARQQHYDVVYVSSPPYSTAVLGVYIKKGLETPLIVDIKDDWNLLWRGYTAERVSEEQTLEREVVQAADEVILVTPASLENYQRRYPSDAHFSLITNGVDLEDFADIDVGTEQPPTFKVTYVGSLGGHNRSPVNFFKGFQRLLADSDVDASICEACFPAHMNPDFWEAVSQMDLEPWVKGVPILPQDEFKQHLATSAVLLTINYYGATTLVPGKLYEYWAVGRPVLLIEKPGIATDLVQKNNLGLTADPDDVEGIYGALRAFHNDYVNGRCKPSNRQGLEEFSRERLTLRLCSLLDRHLPGVSGKE